jgi:hypothetical protein
MLVAGHPQAAAFGLLFAGALALREAWAVGHPRQLLGFTLAMLGAAAMASPQILATLELSGEGMRSGGVADIFANIGSLPPQELVGALFPEAFGLERPGDIALTHDHRGLGYWGQGENHWEMAFFVGLPVAVLAGLGARGRRFWVLMAGASLLLMLGGLTPLWWLIRQLPGMGGFRFPVRFGLVFTLSIAVLAGAGVDALLAAGRDLQRRWGRRCLVGAAVLALGISAVGMGIHAQEPALRGALMDHFAAKAERPPPPALPVGAMAASVMPGPEPLALAEVPAKVDRILASLDRSTDPLAAPVLLPVASLCLLGGLMLAAAAGSLQPAGLALGLLALVYTSLWSFGAGYNTRVPMDVFTQEAAALPAIQGVGGRVATVDRQQDTALATDLLSSNLGLMAPGGAVEDVLIPSPLMLLRHEATLALAGLDVGSKGAGEAKLAALAASPALVDLLGVRWLLSVHDLSALGYPRHPSSTARVGLHENIDVLPAAFLVGCAAPTADAYGALPTLDPRTTALVGAPISGLGACPAAVPSGSVVVDRPSPTRVNIRAHTAVPALLVHAATDYPGWTATVDGQPAEIHRANLLFQGIALTQGSHEIELVYAPRTWALWLSLLAWFAGLVAFASRQRSTG